MENTSESPPAVKTEKISCDPPTWVPPFQAPNLLNAEEEDGNTKSERTEISGEEYEGVFQKKRRLKPEQVQFLERNFEIENKLEPERKTQLAKDVGLQPRQVAIWFQNRRARYKTKLMEKDYTSLKASYEKLKADYVNLFKENEELRNEIKVLSEKMGEEEKGKMTEQPICPTEKAAAGESTAAASSAKSDVLDSESPHCPDSEFSQEEEEDETPCKILLHHPFFPKLEYESHDDLQPNCSNLGFPVQNQGTWFWHY